MFSKVSNKVDSHFLNKVSLVLNALLRVPEMDGVMFSDEIGGISSSVSTPHPFYLGIGKKTRLVYHATNSHLSLLPIARSQ
jgi:hypothetical protein